MATVYTYMKPYQRKINYAQQMLHTARNQIESWQREKEFWEMLLKEWQPCKKCGSEGKIREYYSDDDFHLITCPNCNGTGKENNQNTENKK